MKFFPDTSAFSRRLFAAAFFSLGAAAGLIGEEFADTEARPFSVFAGATDPVMATDVTAKEFSVFAGSTGNVEITNTVAHEFSVFAGSTGNIGIANTVSREFSVFAGNETSVTLTNAVSREFSVLAGEWTVPAIADAVAREFSVRAPFPDLAATAFSAPPDGLTNQAITVSWTVINEGDTEAFGPWTDQILLSADGEFRPSDPVLLDVPFSGTLPPGASYNRTADFLLPPHEGDYTLFLVSNADGLLDEAGYWDNNVLGHAIAIEYGPLPDLAPIDIVGPTSARPGESITLTWTTANLGDAPAIGPWIERIFLSADTEIGGDRFLANIEFADAIPPGGEASRSATVTLPISGPASDGDVRFVVESDANRQLIEVNRANNIAISEPPTTVAPALTLSVSATSISENASNPIRATVTRSGSTTDPLTVMVDSGDPGELLAPASVVIPSGAYAASFDLVAQQDGVVDGDQDVLIDVSAAGFLGDEVIITVIDADTPFLTFVVEPKTLAKGNTAQALISRAGGSYDEPLLVSLASSNPGRVSVPASVTIPAGENNALVTVTAVENFLYLQPRDYQLTAAAAGFGSASTSVTVVEALAPPVATLVITPDRINEGAANPAATGRIQIPEARPHDLHFKLLTSHPSRIQVPETVILFRGSTQTDFPLTVLDNDLLDGDVTVTITALGADGLNGNPFPETEVTALLDVMDDDGPGLRLTFDQAIAPEGESVIATVSRNTPPDTVLVIDLTSSDPAAATIPATVTIPAGEESVSFIVNTLEDGVPDGNRSVEITASTDGFSSGSATLLVTDIEMPDLVVSAVTLPESVLTGEPFQVTFRVTNQGLAAATGTWEEQVLRSDDPTPGEDLPLGSFRFTGTLAPGQFYERTVSFFAPAQAGDYWIVVRTDVADEIEELLEDNNIRVSAAPLAVADAYTAVVQADVETAPAGTPITFSGKATRADGNPAAHVIVSIHLFVRETQRTIGALTDVNGDFSTIWQPLPGEAGLYTVAATHPGRLTGSPQDTFTLLGFAAEPGEVALDLIEGASPISGAIVLNNLADIPLSGLTATVTDSSSNIVLDVEISSEAGGAVGPLGAFALNFEAAALDSSLASASATVRVSSAEGAVLDIPFVLNVRSLNSSMVADGAPLVAGLVRGGQRVVSFDLTNVGGAATGSVRVVLPNLPWMSAATPVLPSIPPGATVPVNLLLQPPADLALGIHSGTFLLQADDSTLRVPFEFRVLSEGIGDLRVEAVNELTYYAEGAPRVAGAEIRVTDTVDGELVASGVADEDGFAVFSLPEGYYQVHVTAPDHHFHRATVFVEAGGTLQHLAFLSWQTVRYSWSVVPTDVEDRTRIVVESIFETNVPAPVITVEPSYIDLADFTADVSQIDITITNHGLIAADDMRLSFNNPAFWSFEPITGEIGVLPAQSSIKIPMIIRRLGDGRDFGPDGGRISLSSGGSGGCGGGSVTWSLVCGESSNFYGTGIGISGGDCGFGGGGGGTVYGGAGVGYISPVGYASFGSCDLCKAKAVITCAISYTRLGCPLGIAMIDDAPSAALAILGCGLEFTPYSAIGTILTTASCIKDLAACFGGVGGPGGPGGPGDPDGGPRSMALSSPTGPFTAFATRTANDRSFAVMSGIPSLDDAAEWMDAIWQAYAAIIGDTIWLDSNDGERLGEWMGLFHMFASDDSEEGDRISEAERAELLAADLPLGVSSAHAEIFIERWHRTLDYNAAGIFNLADVPAGQSADFIADDIVAIHADAVESAYIAAADAGYADPLEAFIAAKDAFFHSSDGGGICAHVKIQIEQEAVITRDGFEATLEIANDSEAVMDELLVTLRVLDEFGQDRTNLFGIHAPMLDGITSVDGQGLLAMFTTGTARWTIVPTSEAAPDEALQYFVSGTLHYRQSGIPVTVPLHPAPITVHPNAALQLRYFHERDVFADDPWTDVVEPSIPFSLGVMVTNTGNGVAREMRIDSAQPEIVENERGLFIDFQIIATEVGGQPLSPGLTARFGDIGPGETSVARWLITSTLHGHFISYEATFEHLDGLGDPRLSLIESVSIHETIRVVRAPDGDDDGLPDFLVNDIPDFQDLPDTLYLSDGRIEPVFIADNIEFSGTVEEENSVITLSVDVPEGWFYIRADDPGNGFRLTRVVRADGTDLLTDNFWQTDRTFVGLGQRPIREDRIHLFDSGGNGPYTLHYESPPAPDQIPPVSAVTSLPAESSDHFLLSWDGSDEGSGIAHFDIYVSEDGGPFTLWLASTTLREALFEGTIGSTYAFYSVATDAAGNREPTPTTAQAQTTVTHTNLPPTLSPLSDHEIDERQTLSFTATATDPDEGDSLIFSLEPGAPAGAVIHPTTGVFRWVTGETHGGEVYTIGIRVTDSGLPALSDVASFTVTVNEVNHAPVLARVSNRVVALGQTVAFTASATDSDRPKNNLTFSLAPGAPSGATIDPVSGEFSWTPQVASGSVAMTIVVTDDGIPPLSDSRTFIVTVNADNTPPTIILTAAPLIYTEGDDTVLIDSAARVEDPDSSHFGGGELRVEIVGAAPGDRIGIRNQGTGSGRISIDEETNGIRFGTNLIGTLFPGDGMDSSLLVVLNENATLSAVRALLRNITFTNNERFPADSPRYAHFTVSDGDGGESEPAIREIQVVPVNEAPVAGRDFFGVRMDTPLTFPESRLLRNDWDPEGEPFDLVITETATAYGGEMVWENGVLTYTPPPGFTGWDTFTYLLRDPYGGEGTGVVTMIVRASWDVDLTTMDLVMENSRSIRITSIGLPDQAYAAYWSADFQEWQPAGAAIADGTGELIFEHSWSDPVDRRFYRFTFAEMGLVVAEDDHLGALLDTPLVFSAERLLQNDWHPDGLPLILSLPGTVTHQAGEVILFDGMLTYTPPSGFTGSDRFSYLASDPDGKLAIGNVNITVRAPDDPTVLVLKLSREPGGAFRIEAIGLPEQVYDVWASENLTDWELLGQIATDIGGKLIFDDDRADLPDRQFYRFSLRP